MITLAFDTSSTVGSVAILRDGKLVAETALHSTPASPKTRSITHSTNLVPAIERLTADCRLSIANFDLLAVGLGPGSFTGIRVSIATAKGYALALQKPIVGVPSMDALALANRDRLPPGCTNLAVLVDAGRGEVYCSVYSALDGQFFKVNEVALFPLAELRKRFLSSTFFLGPQIVTLRGELERQLGRLAVVDDGDTYPTAHFIGLLAEEKFAEQQIGDPGLEPVYLRPPAVIK